MHERGLCLVSVMCALMLSACSADELACESWHSLRAPQQIVADVNGDSLVDVVVGDLNLDEIHVVDVNYDGNGSGDGWVAIQHQDQYPDLMGSSLPSNVFVGDVNEDGISDIIRRHVVLLSTPDLAFEELPIEHDCYILAAVLDVDEDGHLDLVCSLFEDTMVLHGDGSGAFEPRRAGGFMVPEAVVVVDADEDGRLDLLVGEDSNELVLYRATAAGGFEEAWTHGRGTTSDLAVGDFDGDGRLDVATVQFRSRDLLRPERGPGMLRVHYGNLATGDFDEVREYRVGVDPTDLSVADLDGDGIDDIAVAHASSDHLSLLLSRDGPRMVEMEVVARAVTAVDVDGDGDADLVTSNGIEVLVFENLGLAQFAAPRAYPLEP